MLLLDVATDLDAAGELIRVVTATEAAGARNRAAHVSNDSKAILRSLRYGASEFLFAPFDVRSRKRHFDVFRSCCSRGGERESGKSSCSQRQAGKWRFDSRDANGVRAETRIGQASLAGRFRLDPGIARFLPQARSRCYSLVDVIQRADRIDHDLWSTVTVDADGIDVLAAPEAAVHRLRGSRAGCTVSSQHARTATSGQSWTFQASFSASACSRSPKQTGHSSSRPPSLRACTWPGKRSS